MLLKHRRKNRDRIELTDEAIETARNLKRKTEQLVKEARWTVNKESNTIEFTDEELKEQQEIAEELRAKAKEVGYNHKAIVEYLDGTQAEFDYYWVEGKDGKLFLFAGLKDSPDLKVTLDMHRDIKAVHLC